MSCALYWIEHLWGNGRETAIRRNNGVTTRKCANCPAREAAGDARELSNSSWKTIFKVPGGGEESTASFWICSSSVIAVLYLNRRDCRRVV